MTKRRVDRRAVSLVFWREQGEVGRTRRPPKNTGGGAMVAVIPAKRAMRARAGIQYAAVPRDGTAYWIPGLPPIKSGVARDDGRS